jgi:hypothetical protein
MATFQNVTVGTLHQIGDKGDPAAAQVVARDALGNARDVYGETVPADGAAGYAVGCVFVKSDAALGQVARYVNQGSTTSASFRSVGAAAGGYAIVAGGDVASIGGDATEVIPLQAVQAPGDVAVVGHTLSDDNDQILAALASGGRLTILGSADPSTVHSYGFALLRAGGVPGFEVFAAGTHTTLGGAAAEAITVTGVKATDIAIAVYAATNDTDTISDTICTADTVTVTMSADPSTVHALHYVVLRPVGGCVPSHFIAYAGLHTTVGGAAAEAITVAGALATDVAIVCYGATDDTDTILKSVLTADTLTVTMSADPSTAHKLAYMILRAV